MYLSLFEHANTRKHVYEHSCSSLRVFLSILAHFAHLAQSFFFWFQITGVRKKSAFVTKAVRNEQFFWVIRSLFLGYKFKRFLKKHVIKQSFSRPKEQHLIGKPQFSPGFCWKFDLGKLFTLIYLAIMTEKAKNHTSKCQSD